MSVLVAAVFSPLSLLYYSCSTEVNIIVGLLMARANEKAKIFHDTEVTFYKLCNTREQ